jgi:hypothetical protein
MATPGAATSTQEEPYWENEALASFWSVAATAMQLVYAAG